ncbi:hypothetical protein EDD36DRAFT_463051 [Exophiala viscosa]|uniref:Uncharacterized protein n=1 Tax=Exophiala viscosa TaxID=2486360 RepID=A0AAN6IFG4_9EURO|nr:hypothetical protein EDD36DRAFT_463051 [Exophiala viscosa]
MHLQAGQTEAMTANHQDQSPLFSRIPAEIRLHIFELALTSFDDPTKPYRADRKFYRPGYHYHQKIDCTLLRTCKLIYLETRLLPVSVNEHMFWLWKGGPLPITTQQNRPRARWKEWYESLNDDQKQAVQTVHMFTQQYYLEGFGFRFMADLFQFRTARLHMTIRHQDWWSWESPAESSDKLGVCPWREDRTSCQQMLAEPERPSMEYIKERMTNSTWGGQVCKVQGLKALKIEFEIDEVKKLQLKAVVERAKGWKFPLVWKGVFLEWTGTLKESAWEGLRDLKDDSVALREKPVRKDLPKRRYYVVTMTWKATSF